MQYILVVSPSVPCDYATFDRVKSNHRGVNGKKESAQRHFPVYVGFGELSSISHSTAVKEFKMRKIQINPDDLLREFGLQGGKYPKLCITYQKASVQTSLSRVQVLTSIFNFVLRSQRKFMDMSFNNECTNASGQTKTSISKLFKIQDCSFSQDHFSALEKYEVGYVVINRKNSESRSLVFIDTKPGTAERTDYVSYDGPVIFDKGQHSVNFPIDIKQDHRDEPTENFYVQLSNSQHGGSGRFKRDSDDEDDESVPRSRISISSAQSGQSNAVVRFAESTVAKRIEEQWIGKKINKKYFMKGIKALKQAVDDEVLLPGMTIWHAVPYITNRQFGGSIIQMANQYLIKSQTDQSREFQYFHVAVFVGVVDKKDIRKYYVVENGGGDPETQEGEISLEEFKDAFHGGREDKFFLAAPPKEQDPIDPDIFHSTRKKVTIRALASLGVEYTYRMSSVNCEAFASALFNMENPIWNPVQSQVLKDSNKQVLKDVSMERLIVREDFFNVFVSNLQSSIDLFQEWNENDGWLHTPELVLEKFLEKKCKQNCFQWWLK